MKKKISILSVFILILAMLFLSAGCSNKSIQESKEAVAMYYDSFKNNDAGDILDLFDDSFIDYLGGKEDAQILMGSRIAVLGEDVEYNIVGTSFSKNNKDIMVVLEVEAEYDRDGETYDEVFQLEKIDDKMMITQVSLEREKVIDRLPEEFVQVYNDGDEDALPGLFADAYYNYVAEDELYAMMDSFWLALGSIDDIELADEYTYCLDIEEDDVTLVQESYYNAEFENGSALLWLELCNEDGEIKIYDMFCVPDFMQDTVDAFFGYMEKDDYAGVEKMYDDIFYENTEGGAAAWINLLQAMRGYGEYVSHEITDWTYYENTLDNGTPIQAVTAFVNSQFGETFFYNEIIILLPENDNRIVGHYIEISE